MSKTNSMYALLEMDTKEDHEKRAKRIRDQHVAVFEKRFAPAIGRYAKEINHSIRLYKKDPGKYRPQLDNLEDAINELGSVHRAMERRLQKLKYGG
jgi:hypothetical protein